MATTDKFNHTDRTMACLELEVNNVIHYLIQQQTKDIKATHSYRDLVSKQLEDNKFMYWRVNLQ